MWSNSVTGQVNFNRSKLVEYVKINKSNHFSNSPYFSGIVIIVICEELFVCVHLFHVERLNLFLVIIQFDSTQICHIRLQDESSSADNSEEGSVEDF